MVPTEKFLRVDQDKDRDCSLDCSSSSQKPLCASDGRTFLSRCEFQRAKCKDPQLEIAHRGNCKVSLQIFSILNSDDAAAPALETQPQGDEEASSCDQEHQSALEEAKQPKNDNVVIPECAHGGLYKPVQCHPSTGYCWCVLVDTGRPIPGTSTRYEQPKCDHTARAHPAKARDLFKNRPLQGEYSIRGCRQLCDHSGPRGVVWHEEADTFASLWPGGLHRDPPVVILCASFLVWTVLTEKVILKGKKKMFSYVQTKKKRPGQHTHISVSASDTT
ncbi:Smoc2 [Phodopus roborovskii]|uniref:Smoc2 protein n=1 Tax=Phodopus roborovskii TaxID=109678 RepID=A0AAV0A5L2_PHORO|nr:Smoc2 [Phodopus roborovskii]